VVAGVRRLEAVVKLGFLRRKLIWRVERDPSMPHYVNLYDVFGRKLMTFDSSRHCDTYGGDGKHWEDGDREYNEP
jgi:hypothetical protein